MVTSILALILAGALVKSLISQLEYPGELLRVEQLGQISSTSRYRVIHDHIVVEPFCAPVELSVFSHTYVGRIPPEVLLETQVETCLEHSHSGFGVYGLDRQQYLDCLCVHLTGEEHLGEIVVRPVRVRLVLVLAVRVVVFLQLVFHALKCNQTRIGHGLSAVLTCDEAVDRDSRVPNHNVVGMIRVRLSEIRLE